MRADGEGRPCALLVGGEWRAVSLVRRPWRVDQHWWRGAPVSRLYYRVSPEDESPLTLFRDLASSGWFRQEF